MKQHNASARYALLDELRGLDLVSMMLYHGCWDLVNLFGIQADWYYGLPGHLWQQSICWVFILLSGFCVQLGHHTLRRGAQDDGAQLFSEEGLICNETPDDDVQAACRKLGADLAAW